MNWMKRCLVNLFVSLVVVVLCIDTLPSPGKWRQRIDSWANRDPGQAAAGADWDAGIDMFGTSDKKEDEKDPGWLATVDKWHLAATSRLRPWLSRCGLWQGPWTLFAPEPDSINTQVVAEFQLEDGSTRFWYAPDWLEFSTWKKVVYYRRMEYLDNLTQSHNMAAWKPFADYLHRSQPKVTDPDKQVWSISLSYRLSVIPDPDKKDAVFLPVGGVWHDTVEEMMAGYFYDTW